MAHWANGVTLPKRADFEKHERKLREYTNLFLGENFNLKDSPNILDNVLHSANTVINFYKQSTGGGSKYLRQSPSDGKCTPW
jgi:hypothetical protein